VIELHSTAIHFYKKIMDDFFEVKNLKDRKRIQVSQPLKCFKIFLLLPFSWHFLRPFFKTFFQGKK